MHIHYKLNIVCQGFPNLRHILSHLGINFTPSLIMDQSPTLGQVIVTNNLVVEACALLNKFLEILSAWSAQKLVVIPFTDSKCIWMLLTNILQGNLPIA